MNIFIKKNSVFTPFYYYKKFFKRNGKNDKREKF